MSKKPVSETYDPTEGMPAWKQAAAAMGKVMVGSYRLAAKTVGFMSREEYYEKSMEADKLDEPLMHKPAGQAGYLAGHIATGTLLAAAVAVAAPEAAAAATLGRVAATAAPEVATATTFGRIGAMVRTAINSNPFKNVDILRGVNASVAADTVGNLERIVEGPGPLAAAAIVVDANQQGGPGTLSCDDPRLTPPVDTSILGASVPATLAFAAVSTLPPVRAARLLAVPADLALKTGQAATQMGAWTTGTDLASREVSTLKCQEYEGQLTADLERMKKQLAEQKQASTPSTTPSPPSSASAAPPKTPSPG